MTIRIELLGPIPPKDKEWCYTCMAQYLGTLTSNNDWQQMVKDEVDKAEAEERNVAFIHIPDAVKVGARLNTAVTTGPSIWAPGWPLPTCWSHVQAIKPDAMLMDEAAARQKQMQALQPPSGLIPGKKYEVPGGN